MNVALIRFGSFGDAVLLCPLAAHLRAHGADVTVVTKSAWASLFAAADGVERVLALAPGGGIGALRSLASRVGSDAILIDAHNTMRSRMFCVLAGRSPAARFDKRYRERFELIWLKRRRELPTMLEHYGALASAIDAPDAPALPGGITPGDAARQRAAEWVTGDTAVAIAPGGRWPSKRWPAERFAEVARRLTDDGSVGNVVIVGDKADATAAAPLVSALGDRAIDLTGRASIVETAAVLSRCRAFLGNDSGLMHLAEAMGTPVAALFGPTVREFGYFPALPASRVIETEMSCRPCSRNGSIPCIRGGKPCLTTIGPGAVADAFRAVIRSREVAV